MRWGLLLGLLWFLPLPAAANPYLERLEARRAELERRQRTPGGVLPLLGLLELWDRVPAGEVERVIALARSRRSHPLVRGYGLLLATRVAARLGQEAEASRLGRLAGTIPHWLLCGPFAQQGKGGLAEVHPVERDLGGWPAPEKRYAGKEQVVQWRPLLPGAPDGHLSLAALIDPRRDAVVYLQALLASPRDQAAALRLGTGGSFKVFLNGAVVAEREVQRVARPDQETVTLHLGRGVNRLVIKEAVSDGSWEIFARLTSPDGGPLQGITSLERAPDGAPLAPRAGTDRPPAAVDLGGWIHSRLEEKFDDPARLRDDALYQHRLAPGDSASRLAEQAVGRWVDRAPTVEGLLLLSRASRDHNREREAVERALSLAPGHPWALLRLASLRQRDGRRLEAQRLLEQIEREKPAFFPARVQLAQLYQQAGLPLAAATLLDELIAHHPGALHLLLARATLALTRGDPRRAEELYRRYLPRNAGDLTVRRALADLALRRGAPEEAVAQQTAAVRAHPHLLHLRLERARLLAGMGELTAAVSECRELLAIIPRSVRALEELGRLELRAGRRGAALRALHRALRLQPQKSDLRAYLAFLEPRRGAGLAERHRVDPRAVLRAARTDRRDPRRPGTVLLDLTAVEVHRSGLSRVLHQRLLRVESPAGAKRFAAFPIRFSPDHQAVEVKIARVHRGGGGVAEAAGQREIPLNEPWARLWYDTRARVLLFSGLRPGDVIEIEYVVEDIAADNMFADYFGDIAFLQEEIPIRRFEYVLVTPRERRFHLRQPRRIKVDHRVALAGGQRLYRWTARDVPAVTVEPRGVGWSEVADYLHVSTYRDWREVTRWYWGLVERQLRRTGPIGEAARRITAGARTELERIRAIHGFVARSTRYIGLEFGIHGYKPYPVDQVLARKFGDCKDKASLLVALLAEVGIAATLVAVRTRALGGIDPFPASLAPFNHAIAYIPGHNLYLDGTAEFSGSQELPHQDQGVMALHVDGGAGGLRHTPVLDAGRNLTKRQARWELRATGDGLVREELRITGAEAARWRAKYQVVDRRGEIYERAWNAGIGGAKVLRLEMRDLDELERPPLVSATLEVRGLARPEGPERLSLGLASREASLVGELARLSSRRQPLSLDHPWTVREEIRLSSPRGWRFVGRPRAVTLRSPFGGFSRQVREESGELVVTQEISIERIRVAPGEYARFRAFLQRVDALVGERVTLAR